MAPPVCSDLLGPDPDFKKESGFSQGGNVMGITQQLMLPWQGTQMKLEELSSGSAFFSHLE